MVSSGVWSGQIALDKAYALQELGSGDRSMKDELQRIGYLGEMEASHEAMPIAVRSISACSCAMLIPVGSFSASPPKGTLNLIQISTPLAKQGFQGGEKNSKSSA